MLFCRLRLLRYRGLLVLGLLILGLLVLGLLILGLLVHRLLILGLLVLRLSSLQKLTAIAAVGGIIRQSIAAIWTIHGVFLHLHMYRLIIGADDAVVNKY